MLKISPTTVNLKITVCKRYTGINGRSKEHSKYDKQLINHTE